MEEKTPHQHCLRFKYAATFYWIAVLALLYYFIYVAAKTTNLLISEWDEGNSLYHTLALAGKAVPNIDFVHGYPGLMIWLQVVFSFCFESPIVAGKCLTIFFAAVTTLSLALTVSRIAGYICSAFVLALIFWSSYLVWPLANPGYGASACVALGACLCYYAVRFAAVSGWQKLNYSLFAIGCFFIGLSLSFKQSGLLSIVGLFLCLLFLLPQAILKSKFLFTSSFFLLAVIPFCAFFYFRVLQPNPYPLSFYIVLCPWALSIFLCAKELRYYRRSAHFLSLTFFQLLFSLLAVSLGALSWILLYAPSIYEVPAMVYEIFIRIPKLIDRHREPLEITSGYTTAVLTFCLIALSYAPCAGTLISQQKNKIYRFAMTGILLTCLSILFFGGQRRTYFELLSPFHWDMYFLPAVLASASLCFYLLSARERISKEVLALILVGYSQTAALFPYPGNFRYASLALTICYLSPVLLFHKSLRVRPGAMIVFFIIFLWGVHRISQKLDGIPLTLYEDLRLEIKAHEKVHKFLVMADWLKPRLSEINSIGAYPNYGLVLGLLGRSAFNQSPNFVGDRKDFDILVERILQGDGPDVFLASPDNYPYSPEFPYFPQPLPLINALETKGYKLEKIFPAGDRELRVYIAPSMQSMELVRQ